ncbi:MAG: hypothetical protein ACOVKO_03925 [Elstera sp.]
MSRLRRAGTALSFLASYGIARGLAFLGPLLLPRLLTAETYGGLELALSLAALIGSAVGLGVPQAAPRLKLILGHARIIDVLAFAFLLSALPLLIASLLTAWAGLSWVLTLTLGLAVLYGGQYGLSFWARVEGRKFLSTWVDNGTLVLLGAATALLTLAAATPTARELIGSTWALAILFGLLGILVLTVLRPTGLVSLWRGALKEGLPLLATGLVLAAFAAAPRLLAGRFLPLADVGALAFAARLCLLLLVVHQLLMTWHFRNLYTWPAARCDRVFAGLLGGLALLGTAIMLAWPMVAPMLAPDYPPLPRLVVGLVAAQTILWIGLALFESMLGRQGLGSRAAPILALVGVLAWGGIEAGLLVLPASPLLITLGSCGLLGLGVGTQWLLLRQSGLVLPRAGLALVLTTVPPLMALLPL